MDCEQFDLIVVDLLYGEASESDAVDARRHSEHCDRCSALLASMRSTRTAASLAIEEPPADIEQRLVETARLAQGHVPWPRRIGRAISWAGSYAMRPQLAMAALLLLMIGSSLLLLRGRPGTGQVGMVRVTEQGVPEREHGEYPTGSMAGRLPQGEIDQSPRAAAGPARAEAPTTADLGAASTTRDRSKESSAATEDNPSAQASAAAPAATEPSRSSEFDQAMAAYEAKEFSKAQRGFDAIVAQGGPEASQASLYAAKSARAGSGCGAALPKFDNVISRYGNTAAAVQARWEAAACAKLIGNYDRARQLLADLRNIEGQRDRADHELARIGPAPRGNRNATPDRRPAGAAKSPPVKATNAY